MTGTRRGALACAGLRERTEGGQFYMNPPGRPICGNPNSGRTVRALSPRRRRHAGVLSVCHCLAPSHVLHLLGSTARSRACSVQWANTVSGRPPGGDLDTPLTLGHKGARGVGTFRGLGSGAWSVVCTLGKKKETDQRGRKADRWRSSFANGAEAREGKISHSVQPPMTRTDDTRVCFRERSAADEERQQTCVVLLLRGSNGQSSTSRR